MRTTRQEINYGVRQENILIEKIRERFGDNIIKTPDRFDPYDFFCFDKYLELKSRRNTKNKYPTTIIGKDKIDLGLKYIQLGYKIILLFNFTDEFCYYELKEDDELISSIIKRHDRNTRKEHIEIPVEQLKTICVY